MTIPRNEPGFRDSPDPSEQSIVPAPSQLFVLSGPSGAGKDTVIARLRRHANLLHVAVTFTTRSPRTGEVDGVDYHFVSPEAFEELRRSGALLEWAIVHGNYYGTPLDQVREAMRTGHDVLLKIDVQGAAQVKQRVPEAIFIFLAPPSLPKLIERLAVRGTESAAERARRLNDAYEEMRQSQAYDYVVVNEDGRLEDTVERIKCIIAAEKCKVHPRRITL